jgi:hypothetical protein
MLSWNVKQVPYAGASRNPGHFHAIEHRGVGGPDNVHEMKLL